MNVPLGSNGWYLCDETDAPVDDCVQFYGNDAFALQFLNQFRDNVYAIRTLKRVLGATHPCYDEDGLFNAAAVQLSKGNWLARQPTFQLYANGGTPAQAAAPAFPMEERRAPAPSSSSSAPVSDPPVFPSDIDPDAIAAGMKQAADSGVPFCEECARAAAAAARN